MTRSLTLFLLLAALCSFAGGCAMCMAPHYNDYPTYGGRWERTNRTHGRVGSVFDDAGQPAELSAESIPGQPTPAEPPYYEPPSDSAGELPPPPPVE